MQLSAYGLKLTLGCTGRGGQPHQAGHQEGQAALLPLQHQLELRHAAPDVGGPLPHR